MPLINYLELPYYIYMRAGNVAQDLNFTSAAHKPGMPIVPAFQKWKDGDQKSKVI